MCDGILPPHRPRVRRVGGGPIRGLRPAKFQAQRVNLQKNGDWYVDDFKVEEMLNRASDKLQALIDRANQMMIRNLKALQDYKKGNLTIRTDQINVAQNQVNQVVKKSRKRNSRGSSQDPSGDLPSDQ